MHDGLCRALKIIVKLVGSIDSSVVKKDNLVVNNG
jgi:hypothetical protein